MSAPPSDMKLRRALIEAAGALVENYPARMVALNLADALRHCESLGTAGVRLSYCLRPAAEVLLRHYADSEPATGEVDHR